MKQYLLLAYLQRVQHRFAESKLYPHLDELEQRLKELVNLRRSKEELSAHIHGDLLGFDPTTGKPMHATLEQTGTLDVIDAVIDFAMPSLQGMLADGKGLRQELAARIQFAPLGVQPLSPTVGWLLLRTGREARVYHYTMPLLRESQEQYQYRSVVTRYWTTYPVSLCHSYEHIKAKLMHARPDLPVPGTYVLESDTELPYIETFIPLAKMLVYEHIARAA
jgi:hypothetical protein